MINEMPKQEKEPASTKTEITGSLAFLSYRSFGVAMEISPLKGLIEKSSVMDSNPELYLKIQSQNSMWQCY
jgi:DNA-directed RNA polymerase subunit E'/Rpb7